MKKALVCMALAAALLVSGIVPSTADPGSSPVTIETAGLLGYPAAPDVGPAPIQAPALASDVASHEPSLLPLAALEVAAVHRSSPCAGTLLTASSSNSLGALAGGAGEGVADA